MMKERYLTLTTASTLQNISERRPSTLAGDASTP
jgi:hypothetical protein